MPITTTATEIQLSGTVTNAEWYSAVADGGITHNTEAEVYFLQRDMRLKDGVNLSEFKNITIDFNGFDLEIEENARDANFENLIIQETNGYSVPNRRWINRSVTTYIAGLRLKNTTYVHSARGSFPVSGDNRKLSQPVITLLQNSTLKSADYVEVGLNPIFLTNQKVIGVVFQNIDRIINIGARVFYENIEYYNYSTSSLLGVQENASVILVNYFPSKINENNIPDITNFGSTNPFWAYWLGQDSVANFNRGNNSNSLNISARTNLMRNVGGGLRRYNFIGGEGATVNYFDSLGVGKQKFLIDFDEAEFLSPTTDLILDSEEKAEIVTRSFRYGGDTNWVLTPITNQAITVLKYDKEYLFIDVSENPEAVIGSIDAYAPILINDDLLITETDDIVSTYTELETPQKLYDYAKLFFVNNPLYQDSILLTRSGDTIDAGNYNVELRSGGSSVFEFDGTTISLRVGTKFTGSITTTGTVTGKEFVNGNVFDLTQDSSLTERNNAEIRVLNPNNNSLIYEGNNYSFVFDNIVVNPVKVFGDLGGVWLERKDLLTLTKGINEVDFGVAGAISTLPTASDIYSEFTTGTNANAFKDKNTETEIHTALDSYINKDDYKADISNLSTFDPTTDEVIASNMRGTDNANTIAPDNDSIALIKAKTDTLQNYDDNLIVGKLDEVIADTNELQTNQGNWETATGFSTLTATDVWENVNRTLTDKAGFELTAEQHSLIATEVEKHLIDEADGQTIINAIVGAIGNSNVDEISLVSAIRSDLERNNGILDFTATTSQEIKSLIEVLSQFNESDLHTWLNTYSNKKDWKAKATIAL